MARNQYGPMSANKVVVVLTTTFPRTVGDDTPSFVLDLTRELTRCSTPMVVAPRVPGAARIETIDGIEVRRVPYFLRRWERLADGAIMPNIRRRPWLIVQVPTLLVAMLWSTWRLVRVVEPALIHAHWILPAGLIALVMKWLTGVSFIVTAHGGDAFALRGSLWRRLRRVIIRKAARVVPVSSDVARELDLGAVPAVPMGVDWRFAHEHLPHNPPKGVELIAVGRLVSKKGFDVAIRAVAGVPDARLTIIGDGPERERLGALITQLGLANRVSLVGAAPKAEVLDHIAGSTAMLIPSVNARDGDRDGTPVVLAEAVALGVPVIASEIGGLSELLDDETALLVPSGDVGALRDAMSSLPTLDLERMAATAAQRLRSVLDMRCVADRYCDIYRQLW